VFFSPAFPKAINEYKEVNEIRAFLDLMAEDAATAILLAMQINSKNPRVAEQGCVTLSFLAGNNPERIHNLKDAKADLVVESLKQIHGTNPMCSFAFIALLRALKA